jgi:hypothetical protein
VLLGNADIVVTVGEFLGEAHHAGAFAHCRGDADQSLIGTCHVA